MSRAPFDAVVEQNGARVWRVCRAMLPHADAEDAWSETFLAALEAYPKLDDARIQGWLVTVAHRRSIDIMRRTARLSFGEVPEQATTDHPRNLDLAAALARLSERQREAVVLHHLGGLPFAEVAVRLDSTPQAARRASADGLKKLRFLMGEGEAAT